MVKRILTSRKNGKQIPFITLTNGGADTEQVKADKLNKLLKLELDNLTSENVILCNTIYGSDEIQQRYSDKFILVDGVS